MSECETCKRLAYDEEYLRLCDMLNDLGNGQRNIEAAIEVAMNRASVRKSRREHIATIIRYFIGEIRSARP